MDVERYENGVPSWVDHSSTDPAAAADFYSGLFGWDAPEGPPEFGGYRICTLRGRLVAGIGPQMSPGPSAWSSYVDVGDVDAVAARAVEHGGNVLFGPTDIMSAGRMAMFADPTGAVLGLWQPGQHPGATVVDEPGALCWNELMTTDVDAALAFYSAVLGWSPLTHPGEDGAPAYTEWQVGGRSIAGMMAKPPSLPAEIPPFWGVYFAVADLDASLARASELGGRATSPPMESPQGPFVAVADPLGAGFSMIALTSPPTA